jgi:hypothetical protein
VEVTGEDRGCASLEIGGKLMDKLDR